MYNVVFVFFNLSFVKAGRYFSIWNKRDACTMIEFYNARNKKWGKHNGYQQTNRKPQRNRGPVKSNNGRDRYKHTDRKGKR